MEEPRRSEAELLHGAALDIGRWRKRTPSEHTIEPLPGLMSRVLAASFVYIAHAVPAFAVGDLLVRENWRSHNRLTLRVGSRATTAARAGRRSSDGPESSTMKCLAGRASLDFVPLTDKVS
jgi:hypothetical protein